MQYLNRNEEILKLVKGKRVLHLGCIGQGHCSTEVSVEHANRGLHKLLTEFADTIGVDFNEVLVRKYREFGIFNNIVVGDAQHIDETGLKGPFHFIVAGDIIEHLSNPGMMLEGLRTLGDYQTKLILTTPHAFGLPNYLRFLIGRFDDGYDHVMTFNMDNIRNLLQRHGFEIEQMDTCYQAEAESLVLFKPARAILRHWPKVGGTLFVVAKLRT